MPIIHLSPHKLNRRSTERAGMSLVATKFLHHLLDFGFVVRINTTEELPILVLHKHLSLNIAIRLILLRCQR